MEMHPGTSEGDFARGAEAVTRILKKLLIGASLVSLRYTGDVNLEFQRGSVKADDDVPPLSVLTLRSDWWIGDQGVWDQSLDTALPFTTTPENRREALKVAALVASFSAGQTIVDAAVNDDGTLIVATAATELVVCGREADLEESWTLNVPPDVPAHENWSVLCTSDGELFGRPIL